MSKNGKRWVTKYEVSNNYGGPEEGGWWYTVYEKVESIKFSTARSAKAFAEKENAYFEKSRRNGYDHSFYAIENKKSLGCLDDTDRPRPRYE